MLFVLVGLAGLPLNTRITDGLAGVMLEWIAAWPMAAERAAAVARTATMAPQR